MSSRYVWRLYWIESIIRMYFMCSREVFHSNSSHSIKHMLEL